MYKFRDELQFPKFLLLISRNFWTSFWASPNFRGFVFSHPLTWAGFSFRPPDRITMLVDTLKMLFQVRTKKSDDLVTRTTPRKLELARRSSLENIRKLHQILLKIDPKLENRPRKSENQFYVAPMSPIASAILS